MIVFTRDRRPQGFSAIVIIFTVAALALILGGGYALKHSNILQNVRMFGPPNQACTLEAKLCSDGKTYVSRTGQNCEFAECPGANRPCGPSEDRECAANSVVLCSPDGKEQKDVASNCSCGEDARSLAAQGWKACPAETSAVDTSTWKIYRNEKYRFEVRYPQGWIFKDNDTGGYYPILDIHLSNIRVSDDRPSTPAGFIGAEIQVGHSRPAGSFRSFVQSQMGSGGLSPSGALTEITLSGYKAFKVSESGWEGALGPGYFVEQDAKTYTYIFTGSRGAVVADQIKLENVLNSMKFLK